MKNVPASWCLETYGWYDGPATIRLSQDMKNVVFALEGPGNVQITPSEGGPVTLTAENPCLAVQGRSNGAFEISLFSVLGSQRVHVYKRVM